jgi:hypothetical protein
MFLYFAKSEGFTNLVGIDRAAGEVERARLGGITQVLRAEAQEFLATKNEM